MKQKGFDIISSVQSAVTGLFGQVAEFVPNLIGALIVLLIFWLVARSIKWAITKLLTAINFDDLIEKTQIDEMLSKGGVNTKISSILSSLFYWAIMLVGYISFFDTLGLEVVSNLLNKVVAYIPNMVVAMILILVGLFIGNIVHKVVKTPLAAQGFEGANAVAGIAKFFVMFMVFSMAISQLGIGTEIINSLVNSFTGALGYGLAIGFGVAFGWGGKDKAAELINKYIK